jgi:MFS family permease
MLSAFVGLGILYGGGGVLWNDVIDAFGISEGAFGVASGVGLIFSFPVLIFGGRLADRFDKRLLLAVSLAAAIVPAIAMIFGSGFAFLTLILILQGCGLVMLDLSNNALGMDFERSTRRHIMGPLHAAFSGGALLGPLIVAIIIRAGGGYRATYAVIAIIFAGLAIFAFWSLRLKPLAAPTPIRNQSPLHSLHLLRDRFTRDLALITLIAFGAELLIAQWVGIYFEDEREYSKTVTVVALSLNGAAMLIGRLTNGPFTARLGASRALAIQGLVTLAGGLLIGLGPNAAIAAAGCGIAGLGLAGMAPTVLNLVGIANPNAPGAAAGAVLLTGYLGIAIAPFVAGFFSTYASTRVALLGVAVGGLAVAFIARQLGSISSHGEAGSAASAS